MHTFIRALGKALNPIMILIVCRLIVFILIKYMYFKGAEMDIVRVFGLNVKKYRSVLGLSQEALAEKSGLHRTYISAIECFKRSISLENIQRLADALEVETYKLFMGD